MIEQITRHLNSKISFQPNNDSRVKLSTPKSSKTERELFFSGGEKSEGFPLTISNLQVYYFLVVLIIISYKCIKFITRGEKTGVE